MGVVSQIVEYDTIGKNIISKRFGFFAHYVHFPHHPLILISPYKNWKTKNSPLDTSFPIEG